MVLYSFYTTVVWQKSHYLFIYLLKNVTSQFIYFFYLFIVTCNVVHRLTCITAVRTVLSSSGLGFFFFFSFSPSLEMQNAGC